MMTATKEWEICGSDGELVINRSGFILRRTGYNHIDKFDMESMHPAMAADLNTIGATDILYIGHWYKDGSYEEPIDVSKWWPDRSRVHRVGGNGMGETAKL